MIYIMFKFFRAVDRFWDSVGVLRRLRDSEVAIGLVMTAAMIFGSIGIIALFPSPLSNLGLLIVLVWFLLCMLFFGGARGVTNYSLSHPGGGTDNLAKCARLLEEQGFAVRKLIKNSLHAKRGSYKHIGVAELEWKELPIQVMVTATDSGSSSTLDVQCICLKEVRHLIVQKTCRAIAELDPP